MCMGSGREAYPPAGNDSFGKWNPTAESHPRRRSPGFHLHPDSLQFGAGVRIDFAVQADLFKFRAGPFHGSLLCPLDELLASGSVVSPRTERSCCFARAWSTSVPRILGNPNSILAHRFHLQHVATRSRIAALKRPSARHLFAILGCEQARQSSSLLYLGDATAATGALY